MTNPVTQRAYLVANATGTIFPTVVFARPPAITDFNYPITQRWIDTSNGNAEWFLLGFLSSAGVVSPNWVKLSSGGLTTESLTGNTGGPVFPDGSFNINVVGDSSGIQFAGNPGTHTLTGSLANIPNSSLLHSSITLVAGTGISISTSPVSLGGSTTISLVTPVSIANGGTNATSMSTSNGIVKFDGTRLVTSTTDLIDSSNRQTNTSQPCFQVLLTTQVTNTTGDNTIYNLIYDTVSFDQNSNITLNSSSKTIFTAPVTGKYLFCGTINFNWAAGAGNQTAIYAFYHSNGDVFRIEEAIMTNATNVWGKSYSIIISMTAADTVYLSGEINGAAAKNATFRGIEGGITMNYWSGYLLC